VFPRLFLHWTESNADMHEWNLELSCAVLFKYDDTAYDYLCPYVSAFQKTAITRQMRQWQILKCLRIPTQHTIVTIALQHSRVLHLLHTIYYWECPSRGLITSVTTVLGS